MKASLLAPLVLVCTAPTFAQDSFAGTWITDFGALALTQTGTMVTGTYDYKGPATLTGTLQGKTLFASYKEASGATGKAELTLAADGKSFRGRWVSGSQMGPWSGKKQSAESEKPRAENLAKWPQLMDDIQPYRENLESFAHEHNPKWYVQNQVLPNSPELIQKAVADLAAVEALMTGKYAGMSAVQAGFDESVMQHPEAWLEITKNRQTLAQGFAVRAAKDKLRFQLLALNQIIKSVEDNDGFGLKQIGLELVMGKREPLKTKILLPIKPLFEGVGLNIPTDLLTEWEATAETLVATAKRKAIGTKPAGSYTNAAFAAQVKESWAKVWPERKIVKISFSRPSWFVTTNALGTPLYRHYGGMVQYRVAGFDYIVEQGFQRREDYQGGGKYTYRAAPYEPEIRIVKG